MTPPHPNRQRRSPGFGTSLRAVPSEIWRGRERQDASQRGPDEPHRIPPSFWNSGLVLASSFAQVRHPDFFLGRGKLLIENVIFGSFYGGRTIGFPIDLFFGLHAGIGL